MTQRFISGLPYLVVLVIAAALYVQLGRMNAIGPGGHLGPALWPKTVLVLTMIVCAYEIVKRFVANAGVHDAAGMLESIVEESGEGAAQESEGEKRYPHLLWGGVGVTVAYVGFIEILGFFLSTAIYLAAFMLIGRFRRARAVVAASVLGSLVFTFIFSKVVYVSLPLGEGPFRELSLGLMQLMGVR